MSRVIANDWVFTINNYDLEDIGRLVSLSRMKYETWFGEEEAPTTGTKHLQGYIHCEIRTERKTLERLLGGHAWTEPTHDSMSAIGYCLKECCFWSNLVEGDELLRLRKMIESAKEFGTENNWLGSVLMNSFEAPKYEVAKCYHDTWKWNWECGEREKERRKEEARRHGRTPKEETEE